MKIAMTSVVLLAYVAILVLIFWGIAQLIKYFIRYGIDYYFKKLEESKNSENIRRTTL